MTDNKRFTDIEVDEDGFIYMNDNYDGGFHSFSEKGLEEFMNDLSDENEQLKQQVGQYSMMVNANSDLDDEIYMQLQKTEKNYKSLLVHNEYLKTENKELKEALDNICDSYYNYHGLRIDEEEWLE